jgi:hypothetical protein
MPADEAAILGEGDVAFDDAGAHPGSGQNAFPRVFRELQRRAAVGDRELTGSVGPVRAAGPEPFLRRTLLHRVDEVEGARSELGCGRGRLCRASNLREGGPCQGERARRHDPSCRDPHGHPPA